MFASLFVCMILKSDKSSSNKNQNSHASNHQVKSGKY